MWPQCFAAPSISRSVAGVGNAGFIIDDKVLIMRLMVGGVNSPLSGATCCRWCVALMKA